MSNGVKRTMACDQLLSRLRALRHRLLAAAFSLSLMWAVVLSGVVFLACAWLDLVWELSSDLGIATLAATVCAGLCLFAALLLR